MQLRFGKASHGWLPTTLELDGETLVFDVSYLPYDFVGELVAALSAVLDGAGESVARICEEPAEHDWRFRSSADRSTVLFEVVTYRHGRGGRGEVEARCSGPPLDVVLPLWRGLRELSSRASAEGWHSQWSAPFPYAALDRLTERVEHERA